MNIDECCADHEPAKTELRNLRLQLERYQWICRAMGEAAEAIQIPRRMTFGEIDERIKQERNQ